MHTGLQVVPAHLPAQVPGGDLIKVGRAGQPVAQHLQGSHHANSCFTLQRLKHSLLIRKAKDTSALGFACPKMHNHKNPHSQCVSQQVQKCCRGLLDSKLEHALTHLVPLGEEAELQQVDQVVGRHDRVPGQDPVEGVQILLKGVDVQGILEGPGQLGHDAAQQQKIPVLGVKHLWGRGCRG